MTQADSHNRCFCKGKRNHAQGVLTAQQTRGNCQQRAVQQRQLASLTCVSCQSYTSPAVVPPICLMCEVTRRPSRHAHICRLGPTRGADNLGAMARAQVASVHSQCCPGGPLSVPSVTVALLIQGRCAPFCFQLVRRFGPPYSANHFGTLAVRQGH